MEVFIHFYYDCVANAIKLLLNYIPKRDKIAAQFMDSENLFRFDGIDYVEPSNVHQLIQRTI